MKKLAILTVLLVFLYHSNSQDVEIFRPDSVKKEIEAVRILTSLKIDGVLDEPEWKKAKPSPRFIQIEPYQGKDPSQETDVKVLYNSQYLYFGIFSHDTKGKKAIRATDFKRDFNITQHDLVALTFDGFNDHRNAMYLAVNAYGAQRDQLSFDDLYYDIDWDGLWRVRTNRTDTGWTAEIAIPWQTLRYPKTEDSVQQWGLNVSRNRRLTNEITALSAYPRSYTSMRMDYSGLLKNLQPPPPKPNIRLQPYLLGSYDHYQNFDTAIKPEVSHAKIGGEIKWAVNPNAVLDLTVNTDFAQADADQEVNNVTRFNVFFPEKRQFFLENASLFGAGVSQNMDYSGGPMHIQPFFSRTIGLDNQGNPLPIDVGGRFVYRGTKRNYGALLMRQRATDSVPGTNFFVGRYAENFGKQNRVGALFTMKNHPGGSNIVSAVDGFFRFGDSHSLNTMMIQSTSTDTRKQGFAGFGQYYNSNNHWKFWWTESVVTRNFDAQMGFISRSDVIATTPGIFTYYRGKWLPFKKILRAFEPGFMPEFYHMASTGQLIERNWTVFPLWFNFQNGAYFGYGIIPTYERLTESFQPLAVNIAAGEYHFTRQQIWVSSDPSKILSLQGIYTWSYYFNGKLNSGDWFLEFAPVPNFSLTGHLNRNHFMGVGNPASNSTIDIYGIQARIALNPRLQLTGFLQKNTANDSQNYNIRFSWEYEPLSYIYLVFNHTGFNNLQQKKQSEDHAIFKISYLRQL